MTFKHNGALHRFAYNWDPDSRRAKPARTDGCRLFWRSLFALFLAWPCVIGGRIVGWIVRIVFAVPAFILFGARPAGPSWRFFDQEAPSLPFVPIKWWPRVKGLRILPGGIILVAALLAVVVIAICLVVITTVHVTAVIFFTSRIGEVVFGLLVLGGVYGIVYAVYRNTEAWQVVRGFVKAKKEKFCPIVEFK